MAGNIKYNKATGQSVMFDGNSWVPAETRHNKAGDAVAFDGSSWVPVGKRAKQPERSVMDNVVGGAGALMQGVTLGHMDEIAAGLRSAVTDKTYGQELSRLRARDKAFSEANPKTALGLELGGGLLTGLAGGGAGLGAKALSTVPRLMATGAVGGGIAGAGYSEGKTLGDVAKDTAIGMGVGALIPGVGATAKKAVYNPLVRPLIQKGIDAAGRQIGKKASAGNYVARALQRDMISPQQAQETMQQMGPEAALVDVAPNLRSLGETVATRPGTGLTQATSFAEGRRGGQAGRVMNIIDSEIKPSGKTASAGLEPGAFNRALDQNVPLNNDLMQYMSRPSMQNAWKRAQKLAEEEGGYSLPSLDSLVSDVNQGRVTGVQTRVLHWLKKGMDDVIEGNRDPVTKTFPTDNMLRATRKTRSEFRGVLKGLNKDYGKYLDILSADKRLGGAFDDGLKVFGARMSPKKITQAMANLNDKEKRAYQRGIASAIEDKISLKGQLGEDVTRQVMNIRHKIDAAFGKDSGDRIATKIMNERKMAQTENEILRGSQTGRRAEAGIDFNAGVDSGALMDAATGNKINLVNRALGGYRKWVNRPSDKVVGDVANTVFSQGADINGLLGDIARKNAKIGAIKGASKGGTIGLLSTGINRKR